MMPVVDIDDTSYTEPDSTVFQSYLRHVKIGHRCKIINSTIEGNLDYPVIIGNDVTLINCHIQSTGTRDSFEFCGVDVDIRQTRIDDKAEFSNSRFYNTVVETSSRGSSVSIEYSHIGPHNDLRSFSNITRSRTAAACNLGSEVSKTLILGNGFVSEHYSSYLSLFAPTDYPILTADGREVLLENMPNASNIGAGAVFANYGGEPEPAPAMIDEADSAKGTAIIYSGFVCINCRVINRYGQPDARSSPFDLLRRRDLTILGFGCFAENKLTGRIPAFSYAGDISVKTHRLGWVLEKKPGIILNTVRKLKSVLGHEKGRVQELVQGALRLECQLLREELSGSRPTLYTPNQLQEGLRIMHTHLRDGRWAMDEAGNWLHAWRYDEQRENWICDVE